MADDATELGHGEVFTGGEFYLVLIGGKDETTKVDWDGNVGFAAHDQAKEWAKDNAHDGCEYMLFRCTPVAHVSRGPVRVNPYTPPKAAR